MKKDLVRAALEAVDPELQRNPHNLIMWIDQGSIASPMTPHLHFSRSFRLNIFLPGYARSQLPLEIAILSLLRVQQPDLLTPGKDAIAFEADFLDNGSADLQMMLQLTEQVHAVRRPDGGFDMQIVPEPDPLLADDIGLTDAPCPSLESLWLDGERLIPGPPLP